MSDRPVGDPPPPSTSRMVDIPGIGQVDRGNHPLEAIHNYHKAVYGKITNADRMISRIREEMDKLTTMGDTVSPEDVIAAAGRVVAHGVPAKEMATLLAGMPTQAGQGLSSWLQQQNMMVQQQEAEIARVRDMALHQMGVSAVRAMAAGDVQNRINRASTRVGPIAPGGNQAIASPASGTSAMMPTAGALSPQQAAVTAAPPAISAPTGPPMMPISGPLAPGGGT